MEIINRFATETFVSEELTKLDLSYTEPKNNDIPKVFINGAIPTTKDNINAELTYISKTLIK